MSKKIKMNRCLMCGRVILASDKGAAWSHVCFKDAPAEVFDKVQADVEAIMPTGWYCGRCLLAIHDAWEHATDGQGTFKIEEITL